MTEKPTPEQNSPTPKKSFLSGMAAKFKKKKPSQAQTNVQRFNAEAEKDFPRRKSLRV